MPEEVFETPQPTESKPFDLPKIILAAVLGFALLSAAASAGYWYGTRQTTTTESAVPKVELPENNLLVYTRCSGDKRYPDNCQLYVSELFKLNTERVAYTFDFPDMSDCHQCPTKTTAFSIKLHGAAGNKVIYTKLFSKKTSDEKYTSITQLGFVDLENGENTIIFDNHDDSVDDKRHLLQSTEHWPHPHIFVDGQNNKVYYSIANPGITITQYDLSSQENSTILDFEVDRTAPPENEYVVAFASEEFLYLANVSGRPGTFDLTWKVRIADGEKMEFSKAMGAAKISSDGKKVAYVEEDTQNTYLRVMGLEKEEDVEIMSAEKLRYPDSAGFQDISFDPSGNILTAKLFKDVGADETYQSFGWMLEMGASDVSHPNVKPLPVPYQITPEDLQYKWIEFTTGRQNQKRRAVLYKEGNVWFFARPHFEILKSYTPLSGISEVDLKEERTGVLFDVDNVLLVP